MKETLEGPWEGKMRTRDFTTSPWYRILLHTPDLYSRAPFCLEKRLHSDYSLEPSPLALVASLGVVTEQRGEPRAPAASALVVRCQPAR